MLTQRYEVTGETVQVGECQTTGAFTIAADTASAALTEGVYWITPIDDAVWIRIDDGLTNPVADAADNAYLPLGGCYPRTIEGGLKIIASGKINVAAA